MLLYTYPDNFRAYKALIAAQFSGANIQLADFEFGKTNTSDEFLKKFPLGKVSSRSINVFNGLLSRNNAKITKIVRLFLLPFFSLWNFS